MAFVPGFFEFEQFFQRGSVFRAIEESRRQLRKLRRTRPRTPPPAPPPPDPPSIRLSDVPFSAIGLGNVLEAFRPDASAPEPTPPTPPQPTPQPDPTPQPTPQPDPTVPAPEPVPPPAPPADDLPTLEETVEQVFGGFENVPIFGAGQVIRGVVRPAASWGFEAVKGILKRIKRRATETPGARGRREARKIVKEIRERQGILRDVGRGVRSQGRRPPKPEEVIPRVDEVVFTKADEAIATARKVEREVLRKTATRTKTKPASTVGTISDAQVINEITVKTARRTQRQAAQKAATGTKLPTVSPVIPVVSLAAVSAGLFLRQGRNGSGRSTRVRTPTQVRDPSIGFQPSGSSLGFTSTTGPVPTAPPATTAPPSPITSPPFTDPLTPTQPIAGVTTQTQTVRFSRTPTRTKECKEVKRKRTRGKCFEGFYEERRNSTIFTDWREVDCVTGDTIPKAKEA